MEHVGYLPQIVALLATAVVIVAIFKRLNLSPVLGYLVAGAAIGEFGIGYIHSQEVHLIAEFGVVFLLFAIGLELTIERLMAMRLHVFGFGTAQVVLTALVIGGIAHFFTANVNVSIIIGGALALSSTAIVLRVLSDKQISTSQVGRLSLATLILQDFAVVPLLILVPLLATGSGNIAWTLTTVMGKALIAMFVIFFVGKMLLRPLFHQIAKVNSRELFVATTLLIVLGTSLLTQYFGLSLALGAFIAGLLVAETQYQHQVEEDIMPFKDLFMGLFFMSVGMTINMQMIYDNLALVGALSIGLILIKAVIITGLCRLFRFPLGSSIKAGLMLAQGGEFAFILFSLASNSSVQLLEPTTAQILLLVVTITMALTPALASLGQWIAKKVDSPADEADSLKSLNIGDINKHVVIAGYRTTGQMVAKLLAVKKIPFLIIEPDARIVGKYRKQSVPIYHGDPSKAAPLRSVGIERAQTAIITIKDELLAKKTIRSMRRLCKNISIIARVENPSQSESLKKMGVTMIFPEDNETGMQLAGKLLSTMDMTDADISHLKNEFRTRNYDDAIEITPDPVETTAKNIN